MAGNTSILSAVQTIIQGMSRYSSANVTIGDTRILGAGKGPWAILWPGLLNAERDGDWGQVVYVWQNYVELWRPFVGDSLTSIIADLDDVAATLMTYPTINRATGIANLVVGQVGRPQYLRPAGSTAATKPTHVGFNIPITTIEHRTHAGSGEFA